MRYFSSYTALVISSLQLRLGTSYAALASAANSCVSIRLMLRGHHPFLALLQASLPYWYSGLSVQQNDG